MISVMPKGVEHRLARSTSVACSVVMISVMPKGVEHDRWHPLYYTIRVEVMISVMPKGVEHIAPEHCQYRDCRGDDICDAERR